MQSDGNSFGVDVVSDSFNKTFQDEVYQLDIIYKANMPGLFLWWFSIFITLYENAYQHNSGTKTQFY